MFQFFKKLFRPKNKTLTTIAEMEQKKRDLELQLELLDELEKEIRKQQDLLNNNTTQK